ncbi:MAG: hypothetical protein JOZ42_11280 [Acetobacteraceae bacterium]|nr:hypothetical protein [Acetobacteraceae bacterium]
MTPSDKPEQEKSPAPYISPPPSKEDVDQVSRDQALIADEWAPAQPPADKPQNS